MGRRISTAHPGRPKDAGLAVRRRHEILRHAIQHFARFGYPNADLDAIAAEIGCGKGTLYRYFKSKSDLFRQAVDMVMRELLEITSANQSTDGVELLEHGVRVYLTYFDEHPEYVELLIQERAGFRDRKKPPTYFEYRDAHRERWRGQLRELMEGSRVRTVPADRVLDVVGDLLYGTIFTNYFAGRRKALGQQIADVMDVLFHGILTPQEVLRRSRG